MITWDESFSTGLPEIDEQHQNLIDKCNEFFQAIVNGTGRETAGDVLDYLRYYAAWHFEKEETCMEEYRCPAAAANKKAHGEFLDKFERFYAQWQASTMDWDLMFDTLLELGVWIETHIRRIDTKLGLCVRR